MCIRQSYNVRLIKKKIHQRGCNVVQLIECLLSIHEAPGSISSPWEMETGTLAVQGPPQLQISSSAWRQTVSKQKQKQKPEKVRISTLRQLKTKS